MATLIPKKYPEGSFEDTQYQAFGYDDATNNREIRRNNRRFNRYLRSDAGQRMRAKFDADAAFAEQQRQQEAKETVAQLWEAAGGIEGIVNSIQNIRNLNTPTESEVSAEPVLVPKISYWDRVAKQYGFEDSNAVRAWQAQNGLVADGKFGNNSRAVWNRLNGVSATPYWDAVARANGFENAAAVATWQAQHGLVADGKIGAKTLAALKAAASNPTWKPVMVHNAFDETPVAIVNIPSTKKDVPADQWSGEGVAPPLLAAANPEPEPESGYIPWFTSLYQPQKPKQTQNRNNPPRHTSWQK